jgi:ribosomal protein S6--L-glutamate ligase
MRIGILSRNPALYSTRRLARAAWERGHEVQIVDTTAVAVHLGRAGETPGDMQLVVNGVAGLASTSQLPKLDAVIPRIGTSVTFYGLAVVRQFEAAGIFTTASSQGIARSRDKLESLQIMAQARLPIPRTAVIARPEALLAAVEAVGGLPIVVKLIRGTQGRGVILANYLSTISAVLKRARELHQQAILQEFITEAGGRDLRVIIVGDRCVAAMERQAAEGEFRANLHRGGSAVPVELDAASRSLALRAARAHGLAMAGVDLIPSNRGPLLLEVNSSPGLEGIEHTTGVDVAGAIIDYVEQNAGRSATS